MTYDLTVIIPVYNTEKYLRRCLESIVNQDDIEKCSLKVICINDGSTDGSKKIIEEFLELRKETRGKKRITRVK